MRQALVTGVAGQDGFEAMVRAMAAHAPRCARRHKLPMSHGCHVALSLE
jgi:hypothetical protein